MLDAEGSRRHAHPVFFHLQDGEALWHLPPAAQPDHQDAFKALSTALQQKDDKNDRQRLQTLAEAAYAAVRLAQTQPWPTTSLLRRLLQALCAMATNACSSLSSADRAALGAGVELKAQACASTFEDSAERDDDISCREAAQEDLRVFLTLLCHTLGVTQAHFKSTADGKSGKRVLPRGPVSVSQWLELKASSAKCLAAAYKDIIAHKLIHFAGTMQAAQKLVTLTAIELSLDGSVPADKASRCHVESSRLYFAEILAQPFHSTSDAAAADHLDLLLRSLCSQSPGGPDALARIIAAVHQHSASASLSILGKLLNPAEQPEAATFTSRVAAVHGFFIQASAVDQAALGALFLQDLAAALNANEASVRKLILDILTDSLAAQRSDPISCQQKARMLNFFLAALLDRDVSVRAKAAVSLGQLAETLWSVSQASAESKCAKVMQCLEALTCRLLDKTQTVRTKAAQALIDLLKAMPCDGGLLHAKFSEQATDKVLPTVLQILTAAPDSPLTSQDMQQAVLQITKLLARSPCTRITILQKVLADGSKISTLGPIMNMLLPTSQPACLDVWLALCSLPSCNSKPSQMQDAEVLAAMQLHLKIVRALLQQTAARPALLRAAFQQLYAEIRRLREAVPDASMEKTMQLLRVIACGDGAGSTESDRRGELLLLLAAIHVTIRLAFPVKASVGSDSGSQLSRSQASAAIAAVGASLDALHASLASGNLAEADRAAVRDVLMESADYLLQSVHGRLLHHFLKVLLEAHPSERHICQLLRSALSAAAAAEGQQASIDSLARLLLIIGDMTLIYEHEKESFLALLSRSRCHEEPEQCNKGLLDETHYMQQEDQRTRDESAAQDYIADMIADSLPVSVLPLLERLLEDDSTPAAIQVAALQCVGRTVILTLNLCSKHSATIVRLLQNPERRGCHMTNTALAVAEKLIQRYPGAADNVVAALCTLLTLPDAGERRVLEAAAVVFARLFTVEKLKASYVMGTIGSMLLQSSSKVKEIGEFLMEEMLKSGGQNCSHVLLDVFKHTPEGCRIQIAEILATRFLTTAEAASSNLEGRLLQAVFAADSEPAQVAAASFLSHLRPSTKGLTALQAFLQGKLQAVGHSLPVSPRVLAAMRVYVGNAKTEGINEERSKEVSKKLQTSCIAALQDVTACHQNHLQGRKRKQRKYLQDEDDNSDNEDDGDNQLASHADLERYERAIDLLKQPVAEIEGDVERITDIFQELL